MHERTRPGLLPGMSVLGGAAAGFSYEGALRDALARQVRVVQRQMGGGSGAPMPQAQSMASAPLASERAVAQQRRQQG